MEVTNFQHLLDGYSRNKSSEIGSVISQIKTNKNNMVSSTLKTSSSATSESKREKTITEWVRSSPIDLKKRLPTFDIDSTNIVTGTIRRTNVNYHISHLTGEQCLVKRSSSNTIEKRSQSKGITKKHSK